MLTIKQRILCWLGMHRDVLKPEAVTALQDILEEVKENKEVISNYAEPKEEDMGNQYSYVWDGKKLEQPKEEPVVNYCDSRTDDERARDEELQNNSVTTSTSTEWTPTPGEMIEVSIDGEEWIPKPRRFKQMVHGKYGCYLDTDEYSFYEIRKYARPLKEDIELLPEFVVNFDSLQENFTAKMATQIELLTNTVNQLIKANKK